MSERFRLPVLPFEQDHAYQLMLADDEAEQRARARDRDLLQRPWAYDADLPRAEFEARGDVGQWETEP